MWTLLCLVVVVAVVSADQKVRPSLECDLTADCVEVPRSSCSGGVCVCIDDLHYYSLDPEGCYSVDERREAIRELRHHEIQELLACSSDQDCLRIEDSTCQDGQCKCDEGLQYHMKPVPACYTMDERKELFKQHLEKVKAKKAKKEKGETVVDSDNVLLSNKPPVTSCASDADCSDYEHAVCAEEKCACQEGDKFRGYGEHIGCYGVNVPEELSRGKREGREGHGRLTAAPVQQVGSQSCTVETQAEDCPVENSGCHPQQLVCACFTGFGKTNGKCKEVALGSSCPTDGSDDDFCRRSIVRAVCTDGQCSCPTDFAITGTSVHGRPACLNEELETRVRTIGERRANHGGRAGTAGRAGRAGGAGGAGQGRKGGRSGGTSTQEGFGPRRGRNGPGARGGPGGRRNE